MFTIDDQPYRHVEENGAFRMAANRYLCGKELLQSFHMFFKKGTPLQQQKLCPHMLKLETASATEESDIEDTIIATGRYPVAIHERPEASPSTNQPSCGPITRLLRQISVESTFSDSHAHRWREAKRQKKPSHGVASMSSNNSRHSPAEVIVNYSSQQSLEVSNCLATPATAPPSEGSAPSRTSTSTRGSSRSDSLTPEVAPDDIYSSAGTEDRLDLDFNEDIAPVASASQSSPVDPSTARQSSIVHSTMEQAEAVTLTKARDFFKRKLGPRCCRAQYLVRAIQGFIEADKAESPVCEDMWGFGSDIFDGWEENSSIARFRRLYEGHRRIKLRRDDYACADRFCYIFLEHDLEHLVKSGDLIMSQGRGRKTAAFYRQAESISSTVNAVRANRKAGRGYLHLLIDGGPGFLLRIGGQVSTM